MAGNIRTKLSSVAVKTETTDGEDAFGGAAPALTDFIAAEVTYSLPQQSVDDTTVTGSFDRNAPIPTGIRPQITIRMPLRGSGAAATAPEWGKLMRACRFEEVAQASAVGAPSAASAGTATTATFSTPFAAAAQAYRGMPIILTGNPTGPKITPITDYTAGRVATFAESFTPVLSTATLGQVPINTLYRLTDDPDMIQPVTINVYEDSLLWKFVGAKGSFGIEMANAQPAFLTYTMRGQLAADPVEQAPPVGWNNIIRPQPPIWANGLSRLDRALADCARFSFGLNTTVSDRENPEAPQGYGTPEITESAPSATIDPFATTTVSIARLSKMRVGTSIPFAAMLGSVVGNRIAITMPSNRISSYDRTQRAMLGVDNMTLTPDVPGAGFFIAVF